MQGGKGIVFGFVAGFAVTAGAFLLLRDDEPQYAPDAAQIAGLDAQIQRLERSVSRLSALAAARDAGGAGSNPDSYAQAHATEPAPAVAHDPIQLRAVAAADGLVDAGVQSGQWTKQQALELHAAIVDLPLEEQGRIMARVSAAINADQLKVELP